MSLEPGQILSHYRLLEEIGAGGMGVVWKATDTRLNRTVALKFLPEAFTRDAARVERFQREARLLAALNHENIATIHGLEPGEDPPFLVMELVEGESLGRHLAGGPLSLRQALDLSAQVAGALAAAHQQAIIHRDLKPDNVMLTPQGRAKLLDFGLARHFLSGPGTGSALETVSGATVAGTVLGTPGYMSPEQARGEQVDERTDIWALGCLLYEMLTGRRAFPGKSTAEVMAAILEREPDWSALPPRLPAGTRSLLQSCLQKDPGKRSGAADKVLQQLQSALRTLELGTAGPGRALTWAGAALGIILVLAGVVLLGERRPAPPPVLPLLQQVTVARGIERFPAWSPTGDRLAFCREQDGLRKIFIRHMASGDEKQISRGPADDILPSWSPDGRTLVFVRARVPGRKLQPGDVQGEYVGGDIWRVNLDDGSETLLLENASSPAYSPDGTRIAVDAEFVGAHRIWTVDEQGRNPVQLTSHRSEATSHIHPRWSSDGRWLVFQSIQRTTFDIVLLDLASGETHALTEDFFSDYNPVFSQDDRFVYFSSYRSGGTNIWRLPLGAAGRAAGRPQQITAGPGQDLDLDISPTGRLAFAILEQNADIWSLPVDHRGRPLADPAELIATTREDSRGAWSPDRRLLAFNSDRGGQMNIWVHDPASGDARRLTEGPGGDYQPAWSPAGESLAFFSSRRGNADIYLVPAAGGPLTRLTSDPAYDVNPEFSPDASRIAFQSDRGGRLEVWVMNSDGSEQRALTRDGVSGHYLRWSDDSRWIYYQCPCGDETGVYRVALADGTTERLPPVLGGAHMSFSPDQHTILDVVGHQALWASPLDGGEPELVFRFQDPGIRIDYPRWSPDGATVLFDRFQPEGGDIWVTAPE